MNHWFVYEIDGSFHFTCSDGRTGNEPATLDGFRRLMVLMSGDSFEFRDENATNDDDFDYDPPEDHFRDDVEADADALASAGFGTDEDYGCYDDGGYWE